MTDRPTIDGYPYRTAITTRWMDNDVYGHVNNVAYYSFVETAANQLLIERGKLDIAAGPVIGLVVESKCQYHAALGYRNDDVDALTAGTIVQARLLDNAPLPLDRDAVAAIFRDAIQS